MGTTSPSFRLYADCFCQRWIYPAWAPSSIAFRNWAFKEQKEAVRQGRVNFVVLFVMVDIQNYQSVFVIFLSYRPAGTLENVLDVHLVSYDVMAVSEIHEPCARLKINS